MLAVNNPIGKIVVWTHLQKDNLPQKSIEQSVADVVDLLTVRVVQNPVEEVANSLIERIFDLRWEIISWLADDLEFFNNYLEELNTHISKNLQLVPYSDLANAVASSLLSYENITAPYLEETDALEGALKKAQTNKPDYNVIKQLELHPGPQVKYLKSWFDASLKMEVGIILADLILTNQMQFPEKRIQEELIDFIYSTITKFGAYSIITGFWKPSTEDTSNLTNRMKILAATIELDNQAPNPISSQAFTKILHN